MNSWLIGQDPYQQSIPGDNELMVDTVVLINKEIYFNEDRETELNRASLEPQ
jgi:hypothetical protein